MPALVASPSPLVLVLGAPGTGAQALHAALLARTTNPSAVRILGSNGILLDDALLRSLAASPNALTLLMGLDQPCPAGDRAAQEAEDTRLRATLAQAGVAFRVVYGQGAQRTAHALLAIRQIAAGAYSSSAGGQFGVEAEKSEGQAPRLRAWNCEKCSDPECEHRLFTALTGREPRGA
jgi:hypothetical protein